MSLTGCAVSLAVLAIDVDERRIGVVRVGRGPLGCVLSLTNRFLWFGGGDFVRTGMQSSSIIMTQIQGMGRLYRTIHKKS